MPPNSRRGGGALRGQRGAGCAASKASTQLSLNRMILGGAFDRLPRDLRLCFAHGGGSFPFLLGRLENAWHRRDIVRGRSLAPPSAYLDRFAEIRRVQDYLVREAERTSTPVSTGRYSSRDADRLTRETVSSSVSRSMS